MMPPRAFTFIGLNIIRILSIVALLLVLASNIFVLVSDIKAIDRFYEAGKRANASDLGAALNASMEVVVSDYILGSTVPNQTAGAFWAVLNRLFIIVQTIVLILSEIGFPAPFFEKCFPVLGKNFGTGALGLIQMFLGAAVLSHHVDTFTLVSAFFLFSLGCVNVLVGLILRESAKAKRHVTSWREQDSKEILPSYTKHVRGGTSLSKVSSPPPSFVSNQHTGSSMASNNPYRGSNEKDRFTGFGFGRQGEKAAAMKGYLVTKPIESLPRYQPKATY